MVPAILHHAAVRRAEMVAVACTADCQAYQCSGGRCIAVDLRSLSCKASRGGAVHADGKPHVSHSTVEKQRRDRINSLIDEVGALNGSHYASWPEGPR